MFRPHMSWMLVFLPLGALASCGADDAAGFEAPGNWSPTDTSTGTDTSAGASDAWWSNDTTDPAPPPPENEIDFDLRTPEASTRELWVPSVALDALIVVDALTLAIDLVEVGRAPTIVRALPNDAGAIVLNEGSNDVTIVRRNADGFATRFLPVAPGATRLILSPDGAWAFAFYDERVGEGFARAGGYGSLQDVSALRLTPNDEAVFNLSVGFRPSNIQFADDGRRLLVECQDGVSTTLLADIDADAFLPPVATAADLMTAPLEREIVPSPDGRTIFVRDLRYRELLQVDLATGLRTPLALPDFPSDLDITPDGRTLLVPLRTLQQVARIAVPEAFAWTPPPTEPPVEPMEEGEEPVEPPSNPHVLLSPTGAAFGSLALTGDGNHALVYTTQPGVSAIGLLDVATGQTQIRPMVKELATVAIAPGGAMAALLHRRESGTGSIANLEAWSLLDLATGYAKVITVPNAVSAVTFTTDGAEVFALLPDTTGGSNHQVQRADAASFALRTYQVPDRPVFVGALPQVSRMAIALDNPTGWITFIDTVTDEVQQLNSFELNGLVR